MTSEKEVLRIAKLARIELSEQEIKKMQKDLSVILDYFDLLKKVDTPPGNVSNFKLQAPSSNLRKDEVISQEREVAEKLIKVAPEKKDNYVKVKAIL